MKISHVFLTVILAAAAAFGGATYTTKNFSPETTVKETAYDRVMASHTLRCGYNIWEPSIMQDSSGKLTGAYVDFMEELGRSAGLKIEWTAKLDWGTFPDDLKYGKVDAMCAGVWADARRGTVTAWTLPVWYNILDVYVRGDDQKFSMERESFSRLDASDVTIAVVDGTVPAQIVEKYYKNAKIFSVTGMAGVSDAILAVTTKKADAVILDSGAATAFLHNNPGANFRRFNKKEHIAVYPQSTGVEIGENKLQNLLNAATAELVNLGVAKRIAQKYDADGQNFVLGKSPVPEELSGAP